MTLRMNHLITTLPRTLVEVQLAASDWESAHSHDGHFEYADRRKVGYAVPTPIVKDSSGRDWTCVLMETHYNAQQDTLIFVWRQAYLVEELPEEMRKVPDDTPEAKRKYGGG